MRNIRPVLSIILAVWFLQLAGGVLSVVTPLGLSEMGTSTIGVGVVAGLHAAGFLAGAYFSPRLIGEIGNIRVFAAGAALTAVGAISQGLWTSEIGWAVVRLVQGATFAGMFAAAEAWLGRVTPQQHRGNVLGVYNVAAKAALLSGPLIILGMAPLDPEIYLWCGLFLAAALVPVCLTRQQEPPKVLSERLPLSRLLKVSPSASAGVFIAGLVNSGTLALLPVFAASVSDDESALVIAGIAYSVANIGGLLSQWPAGLISDRMDRRNVIAFMAFISGSATLVLFLLSGSLPILFFYSLLFVWGAGSLSFYGVCIAHGVDRVSDEDMTPMMSMLLMVWAFGSIVGPVLAGLIMRSPLGASGLFAFSTVCLGTLFVVMLIRRVERAQVPEDEQSNWQPNLPAGLPGGDLDPRT
ncbi:MFS transporter [Hyphomonas sp. FCG-A18]|uniref:MFS transporter n=1 Tax=Hyphomonas sp. FCG-A18 TaxID=3080019 RepID=UPI002B2DC681|nr:MFS transporter [Hyphomonas sp. FCG-A18]